MSLWLDPEVIKALDAKASDIGRSRSWMVTSLLRQSLGLVPDDEKKEGQ